MAKAVAIPARRSAENSAKYGSAVTDMANMTYRAAWQAGLHAETGVLSNLWTVRLAWRRPLVHMCMFS